KTTLLEGSVQITSSLPTSTSLRGRNSASRGDLPVRDPYTTRGEAIVLKPGQQATLKGEAIQVKQVDPELATAWKNNKFIFESQQISEIMRMVARWYDVEIVYSGEVPQDRYSGTVS